MHFSGSPSLSGNTSSKTPSFQALPPCTHMEVTQGENQVEKPLQSDAQVEPRPAGQDQGLTTTDIVNQVKELKKALGPETTMDTETPGSSTVQTCGSTQTHETSIVRTPESTSNPTFESTSRAESSTIQTLDSSKLQQNHSSKSDSSTTDVCEAKELQEGQEIYIQTEGLTVQLAEPGSDRIVIVNGPDGTTMHIQTPEGVPLEAVQALLGIEASDGAKVPQ